VGWVQHLGQLHRTVHPVDLCPRETTGGFRNREKASKPPGCRSRSRSEVTPRNKRPVGQSLSSFGGEEPAPFLDIDPEGGTFTVRPDALIETFLQDCDPGIQRQASDKTARQSLAILEQPVQAAAWQQLASTFLVCAEDRGTPVDLQREFAGRAGSVVELDAGHHPFLSQPASVRDLVLSL
jgi:pimeloyl-ACP methyl ester carboxylesterase